MTTQTSPITAATETSDRAPYVDGFVIAVPKENVEEYRRIAQSAAEIWREHGALHVVEAVADDVPYGEVTSFPRGVQATDDETVIFSFITYPSREARDAINAKVMEDERIKGQMDSMPFDASRMVYGGFRSIVDV